MFRKILIANRGEIALRVIRTARALGVRTVAVYSDADAEAPHVWLADEARRLGPASAAASYLNGEAVLAAALDAGAEAVHPGYGFLAENAAFASAVTDAGLVFVGPSPETMAAAGEKTSARRLMQRAGVPVVPGSDGAVETAGAAAHAARAIGFPVLLKPAAGGGGKGMRLVREEGELERAFAAAAREADKAFGDPSLYVERHLGRVRHLEVQVLGAFEGVLTLGERECSVQRRHQKLVEESPAPALGPWTVRPALRERLIELASRAALAVAYRNAGTVEFLLDERGDLHFIEVNARLQVEHPVTELVTGLDLVEAQLRIAAGLALPARFREAAPRGWAIEVRLCAEDPEREFLPSTGTVRSLRVPAGPWVRWDGAVEEGTVVGPQYDSLLGKLLAWGEDRETALARLGAALAELRVDGLATNAPFLRRLVFDPAFRAGELHTGFLVEHAGLLTEPTPPDAARLAAAAAFEAERLASSVSPFPNGGRDGGTAGRGSRWRADRPPFVWLGRT